MKHAIQYALTYPDRYPNPLPSLDLSKVATLTFEEADLDRFPNLAIAYSALRKGGTAPAVLNASNEVAVQAFLDGRIRLNEIALINASLVDEHVPKSAGSLDLVLEADRAARALAETMIENLAGTSASTNTV